MIGPVSEEISDKTLITYLLVWDKLLLPRLVSVFMKATK